MTKTNPLRRALRAFNNFTLVAFNPTSPYRDNPHPSQINHGANRPRIF